jgi:glycosyltransferase involved in cell wall biosynthesis
MAQTPPPESPADAADAATADAGQDGAAAPVFGFILFGGPRSGALVRDCRLANELAGRGFTVHVWWAMDRSQQVPLDARIHQHWLFNGLRFLTPVGGGLLDRLGRLAATWLPARKRDRFSQKRGGLVQRMMGRLLTLVAEGPDGDPAVLRRFAREVEAAGVTHMLPMLAMFAAWPLAARPLQTNPPRLLVTFQGYELYINYARAAGLEQKVYERLRGFAEQADFQSIAVSADYADRIEADIGVPRDRMTAIPPGIPTQCEMDRATGRAWLSEHRGRLAKLRDEPIILYFGRRDKEKGVDLLLYAAKLLQARGVRYQLVIAGPSLFGHNYSNVCRQIARDLRLPMKNLNDVDDQTRAALFASAHCLVYPSIHREPFGMVPVEALAYGTPAVVPDYGGVADAIRAGEKTGGLHFRVWDSGGLADQLQRMLEDEALWQQFSSNGPAIAEHYSVPRLADRVLDHLKLPRSGAAQSSAPRHGDK